MKNDNDRPSKPGDYEKLKKRLAIEEGKSHLQDYPEYPVDDKGQKISDKKTSETVDPIAGKDLGKGIPEIRDQKRLVQQYGGQPGDWVKLSSKPRDVSDGIGKQAKPWEVHGYKNMQTGQVKELKGVDVNRRSSEKKAATQKKEKMDNKDLPQRGELTKKFNENAKDTTGNKKTETKAETPQKQDFAKKGELPKKEELKKQFNENAKDITRREEPGAGGGGDRGGGKKDGGDPPPTPRKPDRPRFG